MYKSIVKSVKAGSYLGAVPGGGLTEEGRGSCALKGKKESGGSSLRGMNADTLEETQGHFILCRRAVSICHLAPPAGDSQPREQTGASTVTWS